MDEMLLNELYGSEQIQEEEQVKQAQVELVEAVAAEAGVDLNDLDDEELAKFAHYVLSDEDEVKEASYLLPAAAAAGGALGAHKGRKYMREAGMSEKEMDDVQSMAGGGARGFGKTLLGGTVGTVGGAALGGLVGGQSGALLGGIAGNLSGTGYGMYRGYKDEVAKGRKAAAQKKTAALEEADLMGRQMAHSYLDEMNALTAGDDMYDDTHIKIASAMDDVADAWDMEKEAGIRDVLKAGKKKLKKGYRFAMGHNAAGKGGSLAKLVGIKARRAGQKMYGERAARGAIALGTAGLAGYGAKKGYDRFAGSEKTSSYANFMVHELEKSASYEIFDEYDDFNDMVEKRAHLLADAGYEALALAELCTPDEFAKEAEFRAAEILVANGVHPETFEDIEPEEVKIASFPGVEYAADEHEAEALTEYNDMLDTAALHIIDSLFED